MTIGVLCLQGAFAEHEARLKELGAQGILVTPIEKMIL